MSNLVIELTNPIKQINLDRLRSVAGTGPVFILTHDNPDPDALASGKALATLFREAWGISGRLVYNGLVSRAENQTVLNRLNTVQPRHIVIDHHYPVRETLDTVLYSDIRILTVMDEIDEGEELIASS